MDKETIKQEELNGMFDRLDHEVQLLYEALEGRGDDIEKEYADKVMRAQLENLGEVVEVMSKHLGDGEKVSVTTPSQLNMEDKE